MNRVIDNGDHFLFKNSEGEYHISKSDYAKLGPEGKLMKF